MEKHKSVFHLSQNLEAGAGNHVTPEFNAFHLQVGFSLFSLALARLAIVSIASLKQRSRLFFCVHANSVTTCPQTEDGQRCVYE